MVRYLDLEFDMVVDSIENGTIPSLDGIEEFRRHLEPNLLPDPERAAELRSIGRPSDCPGWCRHVWPKLRLVSAAASGSFASYVPLAQRYLGPNVDISSGYYGSTEAGLGVPYNSQELNLYRFTKRSVIEFLDIEKGSDSASSLSQLWEVEAGKRYEIMVTTSDGLWRYRLGDVVEIAGFDPTEGPVMRFVERRSVTMRFYTFMLTEKDLRDAMSSAILSIPRVNVCNWTTTMDERQIPSTVGFFVELADNEVSDLMLSAPDRVLDALKQLNPNVAFSIRSDYFRKPTIRLVRPGTFSDFLQLKIDEGSQNVGQIKVPVVLPKDEYVTWFSSRVVREL